jgi:hypothetical protein
MPSFKSPALPRRAPPANECVDHPHGRCSYLIYFRFRGIADTAGHADGFDSVRVISRRRISSVAFGVKRRFSEAQLQNRMFECALVALDCSRDRLRLVIRHLRGGREQAARG